MCLRHSSQSTWFFDARREHARKRSDQRAGAYAPPLGASPLPGLFLVGGSAHPGGGLPLVLLSAEITAGLVGPAGQSPRR